MRTSLHPQAKFDPIPPDLNLHGLVDRTPNFKWVQRVSRAQIRNLGQQEFEKLVQIHIIAGGKPLVIDGWDSVLPQWLFNVDWLEKTYDKKQENVRDIPTANDIPMTMGHYLRSMRQLTNQWTPHTFRDERRQRLYLKDIDCPIEWRDALQKVIHPSLFYLNENVSAHGGSNRQDDDMFHGDATASPAGDLMSSLPVEMRAENFMCYIGHEGTYTPAHREMCASLGQNIMVETSGDEGGEKAGSSVWFMTESKDREVVREYFLSMLGHDIEIEKHFAQVNAWKKAPFDVYIVEQRAGDFILIPPLAAHQVWNRGTRTMKVAWNRTTVETLDLALHEALPKARLVCRDEQYKNKAIIYFTLQKYFCELQEMKENADMTHMSFMGIGQDIVRNSPRAKQLAWDFKKLFGLFSEILVDEVFAFKEKDVEFLAFDSCVTCSYCRSNIFNRFLTCKHCVRTLVSGDEDAYDVCMECYAMGRSCACLSGLQWCEQWSWSELVESYDTWRAMVIMNDGYIDVQTSPQPFEVARQKTGKKSVAQICQEALRRRPWKDITKPDREKISGDSEGDGDDRAKKKSKRKKKKGDIRRCHVCCHKDYSYRVHECTNPGCTEAYCYGVLYRAFDMMPQKVLEDEYWQCPKCLGMCSCGSCRRSGNTNAYTPKTTHLGHDTRPIADDRSVEALVDFRVHNLSWLKAVGEESRSKDSRRMQRLREQADNAKARDLTQAMQGDGDTVDAPDMASTEAPTLDGYGPQREILGQQESVVKDCAPHEDVGHGEGGAAPPDNAAGSAGTFGTGEAESSSYPDPSVFVRQRIGMGYYEQDDTPDKILFDPYQAPSAESIKLSEHNVPEFIKKSIRPAKRKAKRENEDPDFVVGKSHYKKPRLAHRADLLDSMDPALFDSPAAPEANTHDEPAEHSETEQNRPTEPMSRDSSEQASHKRHGMPRFDANEPALRHAKPMTSYVEVEDAELEDSEEDDAALQPAQRSETGAEDTGADAIDAAANDVGAIFGQHASRVPPAGKPPAAGPAQSRQSQVPKRRGRPPKRLSMATTTPKGAVATPTRSTPLVAANTAKRGRGRPRKSGVPAATAASDEGADVAAQYGRVADADDAGVTDGVEAQLANEEAAQANHKPAHEGVSQRRTRRSGVTTIAAATAEMEAEAESNAEAEPSPDPWPPTSAREPGQLVRRRGRPRKSDVAEQESSAKKKTVPGNQQFMSIAERTALRGKKFKMGKQTAQGGRSAAKASNPASADDAERAMGVARSEERPSAGVSRHINRCPPKSAHDELSEDSSSSASSIPQDHGPTPGAVREDNSRGGPTVVSLADVESGGEGWQESSSSGIASGDEGGIPSGRRSPGRLGGSRGSRGGFRGRGRGRGRSRGGPRGRPRADARSAL
ncbi:Uncharacterized protein TCAP_05028 [Tolypocladium capitatum]|uniref:JmjC domain-containing protein n=1 Tax=Tolypocladium capitatum TaxID=45235 RepID=A0A2K3QBZ4_9HYPO|nr:Uncharacterized protein TCAP_05028 [Tolypocladium capitatum]